MQSVWLCTWMCYSIQWFKLGDFWHGEYCIVCDFGGCCLQFELSFEIQATQKYSENWISTKECEYCLGHGKIIVQCICNVH